MLNRISDVRTNTQQYATPVKSGEGRKTSIENTGDQPIDLNISSTPTATANATASVVGAQAENTGLLAKEQMEEELPAEKAKKVTDSLNKILDMTDTKLRYKYHEELNRYYVTVVDKDTDEVVREIPNKKLMDVYAKMLDFAGILVDKKI